MQISTITPILDKICLGNDLTENESFVQFCTLAEGNLNPIEMAAFLTALKAKGETIDEITGAVHALRKVAVPFPQSQKLKNNHIIVDCAGTGGDGLQTLNISTAVAIMLSCAGVKVAKHGNRAVSSKCGTADLLAHCGVNIECSPMTAKKSLEQTGICFLFAPHYHVGAQFVKEVRSTLKVRTIFNLLGPLLNPLQPDYQLIGVYDPKLCHPLAQVLKNLHIKKALVIHGSGLDEIAIHGSTVGALLNNGEITDFSISPEEVGLERYPIEAIRGNDVDHNRTAFLALLRGNGETAFRASVSINAGTLLWLVNSVSSIQEGIKLIQSLLNTNAGYLKLHQFIEASHAR
ncbi:MAG: anthranilate phosphoribosyltransferase [Gammaproteobacteria bacterium 39-13]|nr:anthranilate phosphoribosyltransferase [Gammaproteobacteria bacterium]OJV89918.1 MAG: anthranilate phosphoribosyltransferase [Gammaproteobacteria bacterium 39-13]